MSKLGNFKVISKYNNDCNDKIKSSKLIHPDSNFKIFWEFFTLIITLIVTFLFPLMVVFSIPISRNYIIFDIFITVTFITDIIIQFNSAYFEKNELVCDRKLIASNYFRKWFLVDFLASIPFLWLMGSTRFAMTNRIFRFMRLTRLLKLFGTSKTLRRVRNIAFINPAILRLFVLIFWILIAAHLITCGWIFIGGSGNYTLEGSDSNQVIYLEAFYWTITTLTTVGYGDITPSEPVQFIYVIFVMLMGAGIYGFTIGNIANIISNIDTAKTQFREQLQNIDTFLKFRNIPHSLQKKIRDYYNYLWEKRRGYEESEILTNLPSSLGVQVSLFLNKDMIEKVPLFETASQELIREIIMNLRPVVYTPGDTVVRYGEIGREMFFIGSGALEVRNNEGNITFAVLKAGQFFGEIALVMRTNRTATVVACGYCDLYVLDKETFDNILQRYPKFAEGVAELSEKRRSEIFATKEEIVRET